MHSKEEKQVTEEQSITYFILEKKDTEKAFHLMLQAYQKPIYYYIRRMVLAHEDADDICQITFIKAWKNLDRFRGESKVSTWLHRIAYNETMTFLSKSKKTNHLDMDEAKFGISNSLQGDPLFTGEEIHVLLHTALATLPEKQKAVFIMRYFEEKPYEEIAVITGTSQGALKASYHHAVNKIESYVKSQSKFS